MREGREQGDLMEGFQAYPVLQPPGQQQRQYYAIPWKQLKDLKTACAQYGPSVPFTLTVLETMAASHWLPPHDRKALAQACLTGRRGGGGNSCFGLLIMLISAAILQTLMLRLEMGLPMSS